MLGQLALAQPLLEGAQRGEAVLLQGVSLAVSVWRVSDAGRGARVCGGLRAAADGGRQLQQLQQQQLPTGVRATRCRLLLGSSSASNWSWLMWAKWLRRCLKLAPGRVFHAATCAWLARNCSSACW
jgi:hypothetical protein